jgi:hypothetical protein
LNDDTIAAGMGFGTIHTTIWKLSPAWRRFGSQRQCMGNTEIIEMAMYKSWALEPE